jgi:hypothetical protein
MGKKRSVAGHRRGRSGARPVVIGEEEGRPVIGEEKGRPVVREEPGHGRSSGKKQGTAGRRGRSGARLVVVGEEEVRPVIVEKEEGLCLARVSAEGIE